MKNDLEMWDLLMPNREIALLQHSKNVENLQKLDSYKCRIKCISAQAVLAQTQAAYLTGIMKGNKSFCHRAARWQPGMLSADPWKHHTHQNQLPLPLINSVTPVTPTHSQAPAD